MFKGRGLKSIAGQNSGCFVKGTMQGGVTATQIIVVHGRQVVVDKGIGVEKLNGLSSGDG